MVVGSTSSCGQIWLPPGESGGCSLREDRPEFPAIPGTVLAQDASYLRVDLPLIFL